MALREVSRGGVRPDTVLEIGCGDGSFAAALARQFSDAKIRAIDPSKRAVDRARRNCSCHKNVELSVGFAESVPASAGSVDTVFSILSFHHWDDKQQGLFEVSRVLKRGGLLILGDPLSDGLLKNGFINWLAEKTDGGKFTSPEILRELYKKAGLEIVQILPVPGSAKTLYLVIATKS